MHIARNLAKFLKKEKKSLLLLGPRQTGKSTLIRELHPDLIINLARESTYLEFVQNPDELESRLRAQAFKTVFIDEVQRLPSLLNTIQALIDESEKGRYQFLLTGSSARKLKRGNANLLPGRIHTYQLGALTAGELNYELNDRQALSTGTLPGIYSEQEEASRMKTLSSYSGTYLKEEIQAEALTRNLEGFARFLFVVAGASGQFLDITKLSSEAQIQRQSGLRFFEILEDTLIVNRCEAFAKSQKRRLIQHPRFFFFDTGVLNGLLKNFTVSADRIGNLFENLFFNQLNQSAYNTEQEIRISNYRTEHGAEIDFIVEIQGTVWAVELKASLNVGLSDLRGMKSFEEFYGKPFHKVVAYLGSTPKKIDDVDILPWQQVLQRMGL